MRPAKPDAFFYILANAAILAVVVAGVGDPHLEHVDGVVEVGEPAFTAEVIVAVLALLEEDVPVLRLNGHLDTERSKVLLHRFRDSNVGGTVVGPFPACLRSHC